ncbi:hypothetical protein IPU75_00970 [Ochrobactrum sp. SD129]|nr:hypothetical protein [Ochrobactrum sp. SD129]
MSQWTHILTAAEIDAYVAKVESLDPAFAAEQKRFYEAQSVGDLCALMHQSWLCNDADGYQLARSYKALKEGA